MESWFLDSRVNQAGCAVTFAQKSLVFIRDVPSFDTFPRPRRFSEKREGGFHARVVEKTADWDATTHLSPPIPFDQVLDDGLQRNPVQWIARMGKIHDRIANGMGLMADIFSILLCLALAQVC
jgi:hypothetical protein